LIKDEIRKKTNNMSGIVARARAKINLTLDILGRRPDGYHDLASVMHTLDLADDLEIEITDYSGIKLRIEGADLPADGRNLAWRAVEVFRTSMRARGQNWSWGADIRLKKRIPHEAGLAGGSSDAAAVLGLLNLSFAEPFSYIEMVDLARLIGSDIPFLLKGGAALVEGSGERLTTINGFPNLPIILAKPEEGLSTAIMYRAWDELVAQGRTSRPDGLPTGFSGKFTEEMEQRGWEAALRYISNDFEWMAEKAIPAIAELRALMIGAGALNAHMSGSGPTVYGIFEKAHDAENCLEKIRASKLAYYSAAAVMDASPSLPVVR
jgi:4-diphosphocytidyl-2-C-methyl-D-erythritol kinase